MRHFAFAALLCALASGCFVGGFDKVEHFASGGAGPGPGSTGSAGTGGAAGAGGGAACESSTCSVGADEAACCYTNPVDGSSICGISVGDYPTPLCLPLGGKGSGDMTCPGASVGDRALPGCCLDGLGLCGVTDPAHPALGCIAGGAVGLADQACGTQSPCNALCNAAFANSCMTPSPLAMYSCLTACTSRPTSCDSAESAAAACSSSGVTSCDDNGFVIGSGCEKEAVALEACWGNEDCAAYCQAIAATCGGTEVQYESSTQCLGACQRIADFDQTGMTVNDTLGCRMLQAVDAFTDPSLCSAAGPSGAASAGGGICGTTCQSYCLLDQAVCPDNFATDYSTFAQCDGACGQLSASPPYSSASAGGNTVECRLLQLVRATDPTASSQIAMLCDGASKTSNSTSCGATP